MEILVMIKLNKMLLLTTVLSAFNILAVNAQADELNIVVNDLRNTIQVETSGTQLAYPDRIKINKVKEGVQVTGVIKRKRHNNRAIRGHVDVELISANGKVMQSKIVKLDRKAGSAKHDHKRPFAITFSDIELNKDSHVAVKHHLSMSAH